MISSGYWSVCAYYRRHSRLNRECEQGVEQKRLESHQLEPAAGEWKLSVYVIADIDIKDHAAYTEYQKLVPAIVEKYNGRYLVRGGTIFPGEGDWSPTRIVMLEFPTAEDAQAMMTSDEYKPIGAIRHKAATSRSFMVESIDVSHDGPKDE
jgi:uncharacterized protein (DUF1330 family)